ncbi:MAG: riboflavin biosynthesis protein RibF [Oscillospiraceae bacterium]|jgi:riboflavin kinase/FMN adenylyltransferase|nr:riboflavin biosynthesis protein RibF [Oscillospiraceae bacterium]
MNTARYIALGAFDGLHLAHLAVLDAAVRGGAAYGLEPAVLLFERHPQQLLAGRAPPLLLEDADRDARLRSMGLTLLRLPFEDLRGLAPEAFFAQILLRDLKAGALSCGYHFRFGAHAAGDAALLQRLCAAAGIALTVVPRIDYAEQPISSTRIRKALLAGDCAAAAAMLGRAFGYSFPVERGERIGRTLGAPTLNQHFPPGFCVPRHGVYAAQALVEGTWRPAVTNIGRRPSFQSGGLRSETHILGFDGDLYGRRIPVALLRFLRAEQKFDSRAALSAQIAHDKERAAQCYASESPTPDP